jgi:hypothetical protein
MTLILKQKEKSLHFKDFALLKVQELGIEGAVNYFRRSKQKHSDNLIYEKSYFYGILADMSIDYIVNDVTKESLRCH